MDEAEPRSDAAAGEPSYRYHRWNGTVIRERRLYDAEFLTASGWARSPYAIDALTGMGEDPYSCGEWSDPVTDAEAASIAKAMGLSLGGRAQTEGMAVSEPRRSIWQKLGIRFRRRCYRRI